MEDIIAVICARKGSKRVKNKNLQLIGEKPLIAYTIETALRSGIFTDVIVNSEDEEIINVSKKFGATAYQRPNRLSSDTTFVIHVVQEMINTLKFRDDTIVAILFPTCPLREIGDIECALSLYKENDCRKPVVSVTSYEYPIQVALNINKDGCLEPVFSDDYKKSTRHNDHDSVYHANYAVIINNADRLKKQHNLIGNYPIPYIMPPERSIDIDTPFQMDIVKLLLEKKDQLCY